jgi:phosphatidylserine decarboxylase
MLSRYGRNECLTIIAVSALLIISAALLGWWLLILLILALTVAMLSFFRDPDRISPTQRGALVAPADGRVSSIHQLDHFEPFDGPATCIRIFLSVLNVHVNRSPCHALVASVTHRDGEHQNALNPQSAEQNESNLIVLIHPTRHHPLAAVRQVAGMLARTIVCDAKPQQVIQRGQRIGMIKLGSTTELYLPHNLHPQVAVEVGQKVYGALTVLATVTGLDATPIEPTTPAASTDQPQTVASQQ